MANPHLILVPQRPTSDLGTAPLELVKSRLDFSGEGLSQAEAKVRLGLAGVIRWVSRRLV